MTTLRSHLDPNVNHPHLFVKRSTFQQRQIISTYFTIIATLVNKRKSHDNTWLDNVVDFDLKLQREDLINECDHIFVLNSLANIIQEYGSAITHVLKHSEQFEILRMKAYLLRSNKRTRKRCLAVLDRAIEILPGLERSEFYTPPYTAIVLCEKAEYYMNVGAGAGAGALSHAKELFIEAECILNDCVFGTGTYTTCELDSFVKEIKHIVKRGQNDIDKNLFHGILRLQHVETIKVS